MKKKRSLAGRLFRLMKPRSGLKGSVTLQEEHVNVSISKSSNHDYQKQIRIAVLEAEHKKAKGLMEWEKHRCL